jgi:hypothetical protein
MIDLTIHLPNNHTALLQLLCLLLQLLLFDLQQLLVVMDQTTLTLFTCPMVLPLLKVRPLRGFVEDPGCSRHKLWV